MDTGRIIGLNAGVYKVLTDKHEEIFCKARGKLRSIRVEKDSKFNFNKNKLSTKLETQNIKLSPKVGDFVTYDLNSDGINYIIDIKPRINEMIRPNIANVDQVLLVFSAKRPDFSSYLLDLFLVNLEKSKIKPIIVVSKIDLLNEEEKNNLEQTLKYYIQIGYTVIMVNSKLKYNTHLVIPYLKDKVTVLAGQTGAGKSTLINALIPGFNLETQDISNALNRGKHTTRQTTLYYHFDGLIGDTPGFSKLDLSDIELQELKDYFIEFNDNTCKFKSCSHINTPGCGLISKVGKDISLERYENYVKMYNDLKDKK